MTLYSEMWFKCPSLIRFFRSSDCSVFGFSGRVIVLYSVIFYLVRLIHCTNNSSCLWVWNRYIVDVLLSHWSLLNVKFTAKT